MCMETAAVLAIAGTAYNAYSGYQAAQKAQDAMDASKSATSALNRMSTQQWQNYKENYQPVIKKAVARADETIPGQVAENAAAVAGTREAAPLYGKVAESALAAGTSPTSGAFRSALGALSSNAAISEAKRRMDARQAVDDLMFNRRLGIVTTGQGLPGNVMSGYQSLANQQSALANTYGAQAGTGFQNAIQFLGFGR